MRVHYSAIDKKFHFFFDILLKTIIRIMTDKILPRHWFLGIAINCKPGQLGGHSLACGPCRGLETQRPFTIPWGGQNGCTQDPATVLSTTALQRALTQDPTTSPWRTAVGMHHQSLQSLAHKKVESLDPREFTKEKELRLLVLGLENRCSHFCFDPLKRHRKS